MANLEHRGKPYKDTGKWSEYNEHLVRRGTLYLPLGFVEPWDTLVGDLNRGVRGHPFPYPGQFIVWMVRIRRIFSDAILPRVWHRSISRALFLADRVYP